MLCLALSLSVAVTSQAAAPAAGSTNAPAKPDFPKHTEVLKAFEQVV
jgi:hypothetical protein